MNNLFTWKYWLTVNPGQMTQLGLMVLAVIVAVFLIASVILFFLKKKSSLYRGIFKQLYNLTVSNFVIGLFVLFFNYENIPFFAARFWIILWLISVLVWLYFILRKLKEIPLKKKALEIEREKKKYLP